MVYHKKDLIVRYRYAAVERKYIQLDWLTRSPPDKLLAAILADDIFKCIFLNENDRIPIQMSLNFVPDGPIDNNPALV